MPASVESWWSLPNVPKRFLCHTIKYDGVTYIAHDIFVG